VKGVARFLQDYGVLVAFALLVVINIATRSDFLAPENIRNLLSQNAFVGIVAIGMTFVIIAGGIDLSVGSLIALCGAVCILVLNRVGADAGGGAYWAAGLAAIAAGTVAGFLNGFIVAYWKVAAFIVTLAGLAAFRSAALVLGDGGEIRSQVPDFQEIGFGGLPIPFLRTANGDPVMLYWSAIAFFTIALLAGFLLNYTRFGRYVIAVGANERAAHYSAIDTRVVKMLTFGLLGGLVGVASFFLSARMNSVGTGSVGLFYELDAIAAVVIGGTSLRGGRGRIIGTVIGVLLLTLISNMMTAYRIDTNWQGMIRGGIILIAVLLQTGRKSSD
jgi:ribose transport system permease protein